MALVELAVPGRTCGASARRDRSRAARECARNRTLATRPSPARRCRSAARTEPADRSCLAGLCNDRRRMEARADLGAFLRLGELSIRNARKRPDRGLLSCVLVVGAGTVLRFGRCDRGPPPSTAARPCSFSMPSPAGQRHGPRRVKPFSPAATPPSTPTRGHIRRSAQSPQAGRRAWQVRRPCRSRFMWNSSSSPARGDREHRRRGAPRTAPRPEQAQPGADPRDVGVDRHVAHPEREQQHARRRLAPHARQRASDTPAPRGRLASQPVERERVVSGHLGGSAEPVAASRDRRRRIALIRADLTLEIPPGRIASSTSSTGASRTCVHVSPGKRSRSAR